MVRLIIYLRARFVPLITYPIKIQKKIPNKFVTLVAQPVVLDEVSSSIAGRTVLGYIVFQFDPGLYVLCSAPAPVFWHSLQREFFSLRAGDWCGSVAHGKMKLTLDIDNGGNEFKYLFT